MHGDQKPHRQAMHLRTLHLCMATAKQGIALDLPEVQERRLEPAKAGEETAGEVK